MILWGTSVDLWRKLLALCNVIVVVYLGTARQTGHFGLRRDPPAAHAQLWHCETRKRSSESVVSPERGKTRKGLDEVKVGSYQNVREMKVS